MAFSVNKQNVLLSCVAKNKKLLFLKVYNSPKYVLESHILECSVPKNQLPALNADQVKEYNVATPSVSNCGKFIAACDSYNFLHLWKYDENTWTHHSERKLVRKCQKIIFTNSGTEIIVADRSGDVFSYTTSDENKEGKFLLGHISLIIDIAISSDDSYLLTCDRDSKIRISCYPNSYNIHSYCLGHEEFVSSVQCISLGTELILTSSGDGSVRLWDFDGNTMHHINLYEDENLSKNVECFKSTENLKSAFSCLLNEKQIVFAVKNVRYSTKNNVLAISFYLIKGIAIYAISHSKENLKFTQFVSLETIPFDIFFDHVGNLVILQKNAEKQYTYLTYTEDSGVHFKEINHSNVSLITELQKFCENLESLHEVQDSCEFLFKRNFDDREENVEMETKHSKKNKIDKV